MSIIRLTLLVCIGFVYTNGWTQTLLLSLKGLPKDVLAEQVFVAGNFNGWNPHDSAFRFNKEGKLYIHISEPGLLEFKCTLGNWSQVECTSLGSGINNRIIKLQKDTSVSIGIESFQHLHAGNPVVSSASANVLVLSKAIQRNGQYKTIRLYLPPNYNQNGKNYPVLYMMDGQNLFDVTTGSFGEWQVDEVLDSIFLATGKSMIVVGIDHAGPQRLNEYNPYDHPRFGKADGVAFVHWLTDTLKPWIDAQYRTSKKSAYTWIAGSSMGGLISTQAMLQSPKHFGAAGIFSPAYWTAPDIFSAASQHAKVFRHKRLFFYAGGMESESMVPDMQRMTSLAQKGKPNSLVEIVSPKAQHNEAAWRQQLPGFFSYLLKLADAANK